MDKIRVTSTSIIKKNINIKVSSIASFEKLSSTFMTIIFNVIVVMLILFLSACGISELTEDLYPPNEIEFAKNYLKRIKEKDFEYAKSILDPSIKSDVTDEKIKLLASYFYDGEPISVEVIGSQVHIFNSVWQGNFTFEYQYKDGWIVANTALKKVPDGYSIIGFSVYQTTAAQRELNAFAFTEKSLLHYAVLVCTVAAFLFMLFTFVVCLRTKMVRRKWLWAILTLVGLGAIEFNWTTGEYYIQFLTVQLIGHGVTAASYVAPWVISTTFPIGALIFWIKRKKLISEYQANISFKEETSEPDDH